MGFGRKNVLSTSPLDYNIGLLGISGVGKTTTIKEYCEILAPEDGGYLFAECGKESGADAISGINYVNCPDWNSDYDEVNNAVGFKTLIDDILTNKEEEYPNLRVLVIDTYDQLKDIADKETVRIYNREQAQKPNGKKVESIKAAFGGFMAGEDYADDMVLDILWSLGKVGVKFIIIGHSKLRDIIDPVTEVGYTQVTTDMPTRSFNKIKTKLDVLGVAVIDRDIVETQKKKKGDKTVEIGALVGEARKIVFRDDNYSIDSKSRFANIRPQIPLNGQALVDAITDAIKTEIESGGSTVAEAKKATAKLNKAKAEAEKENAKALKEAKSKVERNEELKAEIQAKFGEADTNTKNAIKTFMTEHGIKNFKDVSEVSTEDLETIVGMLG